MQVFIKILKIILGIILGLVSSFLIIVGLDSVLDDPPVAIGKEHDLWFIGIVVSISTFFFLWLMMRWKTTIKKMHTQGIEDLPLSISELIDGIIDAMKYRRSVRAEVRQELTDHFTDALANCEDEQARQGCVKELIEEFGDVQLLGTLLRRSKKRCRPLWRTMAVRTFQLVGICFLLLVFYIGWFFIGKPVPGMDYLKVMNRLVRPVADDTQNAWPFYKQAAEKRVEYEDKNFDFHPTNPSPFTRSKQDIQIIQQSINDNKESLDLIRQGNQKPYYWIVHNTDENENPELLSILMPHLGDYKRLAFLMCWQGILSAEQGDFAKAIDDIFETYSFGQHLRGKNIVLIESLVGISIETMSTHILRIVLAKYGEQIDTLLLKQLRNRLAALVDNQDFTINFIGEKLFLYDEAQRCFTKSRFGKSHLYIPRLRQYGDFRFSREFEVIWGKGLYVLFAHPDKEETLKEVEQLYAEMEKMSAMTPSSVKSQGLDMEQFANEASKKNVFLSILLPSLGRINEIAYRNHAESYATLTILAIIQYQKENNELPKSLDSLIEKGLLNTIPIDPFSDKPLVYKKTEDGFMLYSVGPNFVDDGGIPGTDQYGKPRQWGEDGDTVFWPVQQ